MKNIPKRPLPHNKNNRFYNYINEVPEGFILETLYMFFQSLFRRRKRAPSRSSDWIVETEPTHCCISPTITWLGHATFLIQLGGINILTDPVFGNATFLYPRILPSGISLSKMPKIDFVLISHNHRDHMDRASLLALKNHSDITVLTPQGDKYWFDRRRFERVREHNWWEQSSFSTHDDAETPIQFTFLPASHWSQRGLFDKNRSLWGSWMIEWNNYSIYFAGDTAYAKHFSGIAQEFPAINTALLPIGPCEPRRWMKHSHMDAHEACQAFVDLGAQNFIPMHWGTFYFGIDSFDAPIQYLNNSWQSQANQLHDKQLHILKVGQCCMLDNIKQKTTL